MIPSNEFSTDLEYMASMDFAYRNSLLNYEFVTCPCGNRWYNKLGREKYCVKCKKFLDN